MYKKITAVILLIYCSAILFAQQGVPAGTGSTQAEIAKAATYTSDHKYALVIGNSNYAGLTPLSNPVNDANDIAAVLTHLGFTVEKILNGTMPQMEDAVVRFKEKLSSAEGAYGFFFYAGHGIARWVC